MSSDLFIDDLKELQIEIHMLGHKLQGECIIFCIRNKDIPIYSGLIDCYEDNDKILTSFLEFLGIKYINFCCWTHPHWDHCRGFDQLLESQLFNEDTSYYLPEGVFKNTLDQISNSEYNLELIKILNKKFARFLKTNSLSVTTREKRQINLKTFKSNNQINEKVDLIIEIIAPNSAIIRKELDSDKGKPNSFSIAFILHFGNIFKVFLGGDIENETIKLLDKDIFQKIKILKAPHHSSNGTDEIIKYLEVLDEKPIVISSVFRNGNSDLPTLKMKQEYRKNSNSFICTGCVDKDEIRISEEKENFGIISFYHKYDSGIIGYRTDGNTQIYEKENI